MFTLVRLSEEKKCSNLSPLMNAVNCSIKSFISISHVISITSQSRVPRREAPDKVSLSGKLAKQLKLALDTHHDFFSRYDKFIVYYDNGQSELSYVLNAVFSICFPDVEFRKAEPQNYRLLQLADFICSMELLQIKRDEKRLSKSEEQFFYKSQELKKTFLHSIAKKRL